MDLEADNTSNLSNDQDDLLLSGEEDNNSIQLAGENDTPNKMPPKVTISQVAREDFVNTTKKDKVLETLLTL